MQIKEALEKAFFLLEPTSDSARLDAEVLLAKVLGKNRSFFYAYPETPLSHHQWQAFQELITKRREGVPIAYLIGTKEFWSLPLTVSTDTLIPRQETELLVELTLTFLKNKKEASILDLGTGSGAIALACAFERPSWKIWACDCSQEALAIAKANAIRLGLTNVQFYYSNWFENLAPRSFDVIVSNPPYIAAHDPHLEQGDLRFEPQLALVGGKNGLAAIKDIIQHSLSKIKPGGLLLLEHGFDQKFAVRSMLNDYGYKEIETWQDFQGHNRVTGGKRIILDAKLDF